MDVLTSRGIKKSIGHKLGAAQRLLSFSIQTKEKMSVIERGLEFLLSQMLHVLSFKIGWYSFEKIHLTSRCCGISIVF